MKNECSYVRDVLPLYFENMVSEDTAAFVEEHLKTCPGCFSELEAMRAETKTEKQDGVTARALDGEALSSMKGIRRKLRRKAYQTAAIIAAIFIVFCVLLYYFPVYRVLEGGHVKFGDYYTGEEIAMALYIGSAPDRRQAQSVLRLADEAFNDVGIPGQRMRKNTACSRAMRRTRTATVTWRIMSIRLSCGRPT